jgi:threonine aldolase
LGAPIGAILLGGREFMSRARRAAKTLGGGMRQAGLIAAPAITALRDPYERHRRDHALARELARGIAGLDPTLVEVARVQTNIVNCDVTRYADNGADIRQRLAARGILVNNRRAIVRFVTHAQVDDRSVAAAVSALADVLDPTCPRRSAP